LNNKIKHYAKEIFSFVVILTIFANAISYYRSLDLNKEKFELLNITLLDDITYEVKKDKPLLVHFWATWCPTCKIEAANIEAISKDFEVLTIAVNSKDDTHIKNYLHEYNLSFRVLNDKNSIYAQKFNISVFPTTLIYDKDKNLRFSEVGYTSTFGLWLRLWWISIF
jgi:thiol-disulfide isomerase/thioredoxin